MLAVDGIIFALQERGGISTYFRALLRGLSERRRPHQVLMSGEHREAVPARILERYRSCPVPADTTVLHSSYYRLPARGPAKIVTTVHDFTYERFSRGAAKAVHVWQKHRAIRAADAIICVSHATRADLQRYLPDVPAEKVRVIHHGISSGLAWESTRPDNRDTVLFVGARRGYKNSANAVLALSHLPELRLVLAGGGPVGNDEEQLLQEHVRGRWVHLGYVPDDEMSAVYNAADVLIYPSLYEGFGLPILEALKCGCRVVAVDNPASREVTAGMVTLCPDGSVAQIREALERELACRDEQARRARADWASQFTWQRTIDETIATYEALRQDAR